MSVSTIPFIIVNFENSILLRGELTSFEQAKHLKAGLLSCGLQTKISAETALLKYNLCLAELLIIWKI